MNLKRILQKILPTKNATKSTSKLSGHDLKLAFTDFFCDGLSSSSSTARIHYFMNKYQFKKLDKKFGDPTNYYQATLDEVRSCILIELEEEDVGQMQPNNMQDCLAPDKIIKNFPDFFNEANKHLTLKYLGVQHKLKTVKIGGTLYYRCSMEEIEECIAKSKKELSSLVSLKELHSYFEADIKKEALRRLLSKNGFEPKILFGKAFFELSVIQGVKDILHTNKRSVKAEAKSSINQEAECKNFEKIDKVVRDYNEQAESLVKAIKKSKQYSKNDFHKEYISDKNAIDIFQINKRTLYRATVKHNITFLKIGATRYFKKDILFKALEQKHKPRSNNLPTPQQELDLNDSDCVDTETKEVSSPFANLPQPPPSDRLINFPCNEDMDYIECCYFLKVTRCTFKKLRLQFEIKPTMIDSRGRYFYKKLDIEDLLFKILEQKIELNPKRTMLWSTSTNFYAWYRLSVAEAFDKHQTVAIPPSTLSEYKARNKNIDRREKNIVTNISEEAPDVAYQISLNQDTLDDVRESRKSEGGGSIWYGKIFNEDYDWSYHNDKPMNNWLLKHLSDDGSLCTFLKDKVNIKVKTSSLCARNQEDIALYVNF